MVEISGKLVKKRIISGVFKIWILAKKTVFPKKFSNLIYVMSRSTNLQDIDVEKAKVVHGKGLRISNAHPSDQGYYVCEASNAMGKVSAGARLTVGERPVITVRPSAHAQHPAGRPITLECMVTGTPKPAVFW